MSRPPGIQADFDQLAERLRDIIDSRPIVFMINRGNWGDSLIRAGAEAFLKEYGFAHRSVRMKHAAKMSDAALRDVAGSDTVLLYNGNGAFTAHYTITERIARVAAFFRTKIFLPCTVNMDLDTLNLGDDTHFFVRDRYQSQARLPDSPFCHDMAFMLTPERTEEGRGVGYFLRDDRESPDTAQLPRGNRDISARGDEMKPLDKFFATLARHETIHTNRLHVAIGATLLGCKTHLYPNNYFKNEAIFRSSIEPYFENTVFETEFKFDTPARRWRLLAW